MENFGTDMESFSSMQNTSSSTLTEVGNSTTTTTPAGPTGPRLVIYFMTPDWALQVELIMMIIVFIIGVPGNALIMTVQFKNKNRTSTDFLVMTMASYELFGSLVNTLFKMSRDINPVWRLVSSLSFCKIEPVLYFMVQYGSGETLCALAVDRCIKTMFPFSRWYNEKLAKMISAGIVVMIVAFTVPQLFYKQWDPATLQCAIDPTHMKIIKAIGITGSVKMCTIFCILSISYLLIAISLKRRHQKKVNQRKQQHKATSSDRAVTMTTTPNTASTSTSATPSDATSDNTIATAVPSDQNGNGSAAVASKTDEKQVSNGQSSAKPGTNQKSKMLTLEGRNVNKLTGLMFFVSLFYVASYLILWYLFITKPNELGNGVLRLSYAIPMLNCISNPIMFFSMSSRFRSNVKTLLFSKK